MKILKDKKLLLVAGQIRFKATFKERLKFLFSRNLVLRCPHEPTVIIKAGVLFTKKKNGKKV